MIDDLHADSVFTAGRVRWIAIAATTRVGITATRFGTIIDRTLSRTVAVDGNDTRIGFVFEFVYGLRPTAPLVIRTATRFDSHTIIISLATGYAIQTISGPTIVVRFGEGAVRTRGRIGITIDRLHP